MSNDSAALDILLAVLLCAALGWANTSAIGWVYHRHIEPNLPAPIVKQVAATEAVAVSTVKRKSTKRGHK